MDPVLCGFFILSSLHTTDFLYAILKFTLKCPMTKENLFWTAGARSGFEKLQKCLSITIEIFCSEAFLQPGIPLILRQVKSPQPAQSTGWSTPTQAPPVFCPSADVPHKRQEHHIQTLETSPYAIDWMSTLLNSQLSENDSSLFELFTGSSTSGRFCPMKAS